MVQVQDDDDEKADVPQRKRIFDETSGTEILPMDEKQNNKFASKDCVSI